MLLITTMTWTIPYICAARPLSFAHRFPLAFNTSDENAIHSYLIWNGQEIRYWLHCEELEPYIFGEKDAGQIIFKRLLDRAQYIHMCPR